MKKSTDITTDKGQSAALNLAWQEFEDGGDRHQALTRTTLIGRGIAIRNLRLREAKFARDSTKKKARKR